MLKGFSYCNFTLAHAHKLAVKSLAAHMHKDVDVCTRGNEKKKKENTKETLGL